MAKTSPDQNKNSRAGSSGGKKKAAPAQNSPQKSPPKNPPRQLSESSALIHQIIPFILGLLGLLIGLCLVWPDGFGFFGEAVRWLLFGGFALGAALVPFLFFSVAIFWKRSIDERNTIWRIIIALVCLISLSVLLQIFQNPAEEFDPLAFGRHGMNYIGGGMIGGIVGFSLSKLFGGAGTVIISLAVLAGVFVTGLLLALIPGSVFNRYLNISLTESTFVGRLLYWQDGLKLLVKYPFGMGYMGYYYDQLSVQTGVYSVMYLHNDLFQLVLDTGWIPAGIFLAALVSWFVKKDIPGADKIIVGALCLHSFFDFNLQFAGMFFLLIALVSPNTYDKHLVVKPKMLLKIALAVTAAVSLYMGSALMLAHQGERELADTLYPGNTQNKLAMLQQETDLEKANTLAEEILKQNTRFYAPYSVRAKYSYSKGEFNAVIENARAALERNPFGHQGYEDYCRMLLKGMELYKKAGDATSAEICRKELLSVAEQLARNGDRLSALGKRINDQPVLELPRDLQTEIAKLGGKGR